MNRPSATAPIRTVTDRLVLTAVHAGDVDELYALNADARVWAHLPSGRHTGREQTERQAAGFAADWSRGGLGYWTARRRDDGASRSTAEKIGLTLAWRGPDAGNPDPGAVRLVFANRELDDATLERVVGA